MRESLDDKSLKVSEVMRNENISRIGMSSNAIAFKSACRQLENRGITLNIPNSKVLSVVDDCMKAARELLSSDTYLPFINLKDMTAISYIEKVAKGKTDKDSIEDKKKKIKTEIEDLKSKLAKAEQRGNLQKVEQYTADLDQLVNPKKYVDIITTRLQSMDKAGASKTADYKALEKILKKFQKRVDLDVVNSENIEFRKEHEQSLRTFVSNYFYSLKKSDVKGLDRFFKDYCGELHIDFEHTLLLYYYLEATNNKDIEKVRGLLYYLAAESFYLEVKEMQSVAKSGLLLPSFDTGAETFGWKKLPKFTRKFVSYITKPEGYNCYMLEVENLNQIAYITSQATHEFSTIEVSKKVGAAMGLVKDMREGMFFKHLTKGRENLLIPYMLSSDFPLWCMDGLYAEDLCVEFIARNTKFDGQEDLCNMYNRLVKPYSIDMMGNIVISLNERIATLEDKDIAYIYYASPQRLAIAVKEEYNFEDIFQGMTKMMKPITSLIINDLVYGAYL